VGRGFQFAVGDRAGLSYDGFSVGFVKGRILDTRAKKSLVLVAGVLVVLAGGGFAFHRWRTRPGQPDAVQIGPIPAGTPVGLLANLNLLSEKAATLLVRMKHELKTDADFAKLADPLLELSACPDLIVNRDRYFGTGLDGAPPLPDQQKKDLIEFLRTM